jgi:hypothetical protein
VASEISIDPRLLEIHENTEMLEHLLRQQEHHGYNPIRDQRIRELALKLGLIEEHGEDSDMHSDSREAALFAVVDERWCQVFDL